MQNIGLICPGCRRTISEMDHDSTESAVRRCRELHDARERQTLEGERHNWLGVEEARLHVQRLEFEFQQFRRVPKRTDDA